MDELQTTLTKAQIDERLMTICHELPLKIENDSLKSWHNGTKMPQVQGNYFSLPNLPEYDFYEYMMSIDQSEASTEIILSYDDRDYDSNATIYVTVCAYHDGGWNPGSITNYSMKSGADLHLSVKIKSQSKTIFSTNKYTNYRSLPRADIAVWDNCNIQFNPANPDYSISFSFNTDQIDEYVRVINIAVPKNLHATLSRRAELVPVIDEHIKTIGDEAFKDCINMRHCSMSPNLTAVQTSAFANCNSLMSFSGNNVEQLGEFAFANCAKLSTISLDKVTSIPRYAFDDCENLQSINMNSLTSIGNRGRTSNEFRRCKALHTTDFAKNVQQMYCNSTFADSGLSTAIFPACVKAEYSHAFDNCDGLLSIELPELTAFSIVGDNGIGKCVNLKYVDLGKISMLPEWSYSFGESLSSLTVVKATSLTSGTYLGDVFDRDSCPNLSAIWPNPAFLSNAMNADTGAQDYIYSQDNDGHRIEYFYPACKLTSLNDPMIRSLVWGAMNNLPSSIVEIDLQNFIADREIELRQLNALKKVNLSKSGSIVNITACANLESYSITVVPSEYDDNTSWIDISRNFLNDCPKLANISINGKDGNSYDPSLIFYCSDYDLSHYPFKNTKFANDQISKQGFVQFEGTLLYTPTQLTSFSQLSIHTLIENSLGVDADDIQLISCDNTKRIWYPGDFTLDSELTALHLKNAVEIDAEFFNCRRLRYVDLGDSLKYANESLFSPNTWDDACPVSELRIGGDQVFACPDEFLFCNTIFVLHDTLETLVIGPSTTDIGDDAFADMHQLKTIDLSENKNFSVEHEAEYRQRWGISDETEIIFTGAVSVYMHLNDENNTIKIIRRPHNSEYDIPAPSIDFKGHSFDSWHYDESLTDDNVKTINLGESDVHVYAKWIQRSYTVTFMSTGATPSATNMTVTYGMTYGELPSLQVEGITQDNIETRWYLDDAKTNEITQDSIVQTDSDHILYGEWKITAITANYINNCDLTQLIEFNFNSKELRDGEPFGDFPTLMKKESSPIHDNFVDHIYGMYWWIATNEGGYEIVTENTLVTLPLKNNCIYIYYNTDRQVQVKFTLGSWWINNGYRLKWNDSDNPVKESTGQFWKTNAGKSITFAELQPYFTTTREFILPEVIHATTGTIKQDVQWWYEDVDGDYHEYDESVLLPDKTIITLTT